MSDELMTDERRRHMIASLQLDNIDEWDADERFVARIAVEAYLAEHPADDDTKRVMAPAVERLRYGAYRGLLVGFAMTCEEMDDMLTARAAFIAEHETTDHCGY